MIQKSDMTTAQEGKSQAPAPSQALAKKEDAGSLIVERLKPQLSKVLGQSIPVEYWARVALTTWRKSALLQQCSQQSIMASMLEIAQLRLFPDNLLGEAYLVPFWNSKMNSYEATTIIGYKGLIKMVRRNSNVTNVTADVVYREDRFVYRKGSKRTLEHEPKLEGDRGQPIGAYAYIAYANGGEEFEFVNMDYLERVKKSSRGSEKESSPWNTWPEGMWKKTALRQLCKVADISPDVEESLQREMDGAIDVQSEVLPNQPPAPTPSRLAKLPPAAAAPAAAPDPGAEASTPPATPGPQEPPRTPNTGPSSVRRRSNRVSDVAPAAPAASQEPPKSAPAPEPPAQEPPPQEGQPEGEEELFGGV